jgi:hypothetical protein
MHRLVGLLFFASALAPPSVFAVGVQHPVRMITLPTGTPISVRLDQPLSTRQSPTGAHFVASVMTPVVQDGAVVLPRGTRVRGYLAESKKSGHFKGHAVMALRLNAIDVYGRTYPVATSDAEFYGKHHKGHNLKWIGGGAGGGLVVGAIAGGGVGALAGAAIGAAGGSAGAAATSRRNVSLAAETPLTFRLEQPVTVRQPGLPAAR